MSCSPEHKQQKLSHQYACMMSSGSMNNTFFLLKIQMTLLNYFQGLLCLIFQPQHQVHRHWQHLQALSRTSLPPWTMSRCKAVMTFRVMIANLLPYLDYKEPVHLPDEEVGSIMWQRLTHMFLLVTTRIIIKSSLALSKQSLALFQSTACKGHNII